MRKKHIVGIRLDDEELAQVSERVKVEHLSYVSTLVRKATFFYIEYMEKKEKKEALNDK